MYLITDNLRTNVYNDFYNFLKGNHDYDRNGTYTDQMYAGDSRSAPPIQPKTPVNTAENVNVLRHIGTKLLRQKKLPSGNSKQKGKFTL